MVKYILYIKDRILDVKLTIMNKDEIMNALDRGAEEITNKIAGWLSEGSGWVIEEIQHHYVDIVKHVALRGSLYLPLPEELRNSMKGLINLQNKDDKCAIWCLVRYRNPQKKDPQRITGSDYEFSKGLDLSGIDFPVTINQIPLIEKKEIRSISMFLDIIQRNLIQSIFQKKNILIIWSYYILMMVVIRIIMSLSKIIIDFLVLVININTSIIIACIV